MLWPCRTAHTQGTRGRSSRVGGTPSYMSPEMFQVVLHVLLEHIVFQAHESNRLQPLHVEHTSHQGSFTEKCDIWSLGVVMFQVEVSLEWQA
eukprot:6094769-Amphidinium_carterae.2